eukprot:4662149-Amphidinium_carterae.1
MKSSYAIVLARYGLDRASATERRLVAEQVDALKIEVAAVQYNEMAWHEVIRRWPEKAQIDIGTAWNLVPASDADPG